MGLFEGKWTAAVSAYSALVLIAIYLIKRMSV